MKCIAGLCAAIAISSVAVAGQTMSPATPRQGTVRITPQAQAEARNLTKDITAVGCIRAWRPAPEDVTSQPTDQHPGVPGVFLLTPLSTSPNASVDLPTYLLTPTQAANFTQHLDDKVEVVGMAQAALQPPTVQELVNNPTKLPENRPNAQAMPRLTIRSLKKLSDSCP